MASQQELLRAVGLWTDPSAEVAPRGALSDAKNVVFRRPGRVEPRWGHDTKTAETAANDPNRKLWVYGGKLLVDTSDDGVSGWATSSSTAAGAWTTITGAGDPPTPTRYTRQAFSARKNCYWTSSTGIRVLVGAASSTAVTAGRPRLHGMLIETNSGDPDVYQANDVFKYRATVLRRDANELTTEGPPTGPAYYYHATSDSSLQATIPIPAGVVAGDRIALYRATSRSTVRISQTRSDLDRALSFEPAPYYDGPTATGTGGLGDIATGGVRETTAPRPAPAAEPLEVYALVREQVVTSTDVSNGYVVIVDTTSAPQGDATDSTLGRELYTNPGRGGMAVAQFPPALAHAVTWYGNCAWYGNCTFPHSLIAKLLKVSGPNFALGVDGIGYTTGVTGNTTISSPVITALGSTTNLIAGMRIESANFAAGTKILSVDSGTQVTATANSSATSTGVAVNFHDQITIAGTQFWAAAALNTTTKSFRAVAYDATLALTDLAYLLGRTASMPTGEVLTAKRQADRADMILEEVGVGAASYAVTGSRPKAWSFPVDLPVSGTTLASSNGAELHRLAYSLPTAPESCPRGQHLLLGSPESRILALATVQDALLVFKEDGVWRVVGENGNFRVDPYDLTLRLLNPDAVCTAGGRVYAWCSSGVVALGGPGVDVVGAPINASLDDLQSQLALYPASAWGVWAVPYESEGQVWLGVPDSPGKSKTSIVYVYHVATQAWGSVDKAYNTAVYNPADDLLYFGEDSSFHAVRRSYGALTSGAAGDTHDGETAVTVSTIDATTLFLSGSVTFAKGDGVRQGSAFARVTADGTSANVPVDSTSGFGAGAATVLRSYECLVRFQPVTLGNPTTQKLHTEANLHLSDNLQLRGVTMEWASDPELDTRTTQFATRTRETDADPRPQVYRFGVPRPHARATRLAPGIKIQEAGSRWALGELGIMIDVETERARRGS